MNGPDDLSCRVLPTRGWLSSLELAVPFEVSHLIDAPEIREHVVPGFPLRDRNDVAIILLSLLRNVRAHYRSSPASRFGDDSPERPIRGVLQGSVSASEI